MANGPLARRHPKSTGRQYVNVYLSTKEREVVAKAAQADYRTVSGFLSVAALENAKRILSRD